MSALQRFSPGLCPLSQKALLPPHNSSSILLLHPGPLRLGLGTWTWTWTTPAIRDLPATCLRTATLATKATSDSDSDSDRPTSAATATIRYWTRRALPCPALPAPRVATATRRRTPHCLFYSHTDFRLKKVPPSSFWPSPPPCHLPIPRSAFYRTKARIASKPRSTRILLHTNTTTHHRLPPTTSAASHHSCILPHSLGPGHRRGPWAG